MEHDDRTKLKAAIRDGVERIVLAGFMGSGKTTVGKVLAERTGWSFVDLDVAVEKRCGRSVPAIFAEHGEAYFRDEEAAALLPLMQQSSLIIALGGGAPETASVRNLLQHSEGTAVVLLDASFAVLNKRCEEQALHGEATIRPLLEDRAAALTRYERRQQHYTAISTLRIDTTARSPYSAADVILTQLR